jgi:phospholipase C
MLRQHVSLVLLVLLLASEALATAGKAKQTYPIKKVVILMLENRSFDHMLGFLKTKNPNIDGLNGNESIPVNPTNKSRYEPRVPIKNNSPYVGLLDPDHSVNASTWKIFGSWNIVTPPPMSGFFNWENQFLNIPAIYSDEVMRVFEPSAVPTITTLAQEFVLFDKYYPSVPGPTYPNRMYALTGTSHGAFTNDPPPGGWPQETFFEKLEEVGKTWNIFYHDCSWSLFLSRLRTTERMERVLPWEFFKTSVANGELADYTWLEPATTMNPWTGASANDQHPDHDVRSGEMLIKEVYETLRNSDYWNETLLIVTYDEHGGYYDHVPPPMNGVPNPDGMPPEFPQVNFNFTRLGIRVPFILASPWINKGLVEHDPQGPTSTSKYNHGSIPATLHKIFGTQGYLSKRDEWSGTFDHLLLERSTPRTDCPTTLPVIPPTENQSEEEGKKPVNGLQCDYIRAFEDSHKKCEGMTQRDAAIYIRHLMKHHLNKYSKK